MDVVVIDCLAKWEMLLSRKWATNARGSVQMDWSYIDILVTLGYSVRLFQEKKMLHNVEDPQKMNNEPLYPEVYEPNLERYVVMDEHDEPLLSPEYIIESLPDDLWTMHFVLILW